MQPMLRPDPRRCAPRYKTFAVAEVVVADARLRAHVLDISTGGARVHCALDGDAPDGLDLIVAETRLSATVMWRNGDRFGVRFRAPLAEPVLQRAIAG